jgi:Zn-finger nucleic acid-binding protein
MLNSNSASNASSMAAGQTHGALRKCPVCAAVLKAFHFNEIETDICRNGCGVWFDENELKQIEESDNLENIDKAFPGEYVKKQDAPARKQAHDRQCPVHHTSMFSFEWNVGSGIFIDKCETCHGVWMDAGELEGYCKFIKDFYKYPPELTPAIREKMDKMREQFEKDWNINMEAAAQTAVPWDLWYIDDLRRHLVKSVLPIIFPR